VLTRLKKVNITIKPSSCMVVEDLGHMVGKPFVIWLYSIESSSRALLDLGNIPGKKVKK